MKGGLAGGRIPFKPIAGNAHAGDDVVGKVGRPYFIGRDAASGVVHFAGVDSSRIGLQLSPRHLIGRVLVQPQPQLLQERFLLAFLLEKLLVFLGALGRRLRSYFRRDGRDPFVVPGSSLLAASVGGLDTVSPQVLKTVGRGGVSSGASEKLTDSQRGRSVRSSFCTRFFPFRVRVDARPGAGHRADGPRA